LLRSGIWVFNRNRILSLKRFPRFRAPLQWLSSRDDDVGVGAVRRRGRGHFFVRTFLRAASLTSTKERKALI
jgi:hypothetical protein